jgi:SAM-dependent methyltransferase
MDARLRLPLQQKSLQRRYWWQTIGFPKNPFESLKGKSWDRIIFYSLYKEVNEMRDNFMFWGNDAKDYFDESEKVATEQWNTFIEPFLGTIGGGKVVDLACGRGRWSNILKNSFKHVFASDVNQENLAYCKERFKKESRIDLVALDGYTLPFENNAMDFVFSFDSMVHFDLDVIAGYLRETYRVLKDGGKAFFHHSNTTNSKVVKIQENPHWRNFMSKEIFEHLALKAGLTVEKQQVINWGGAQNIDCLTLVSARK